MFLSRSRAGAGMAAASGRSGGSAAWNVPRLPRTCGRRKNSPSALRASVLKQISPTTLALPSVARGALQRPLSASMSAPALDLSVEQACKHLNQKCARNGKAPRIFLPQEMRGALFLKPGVSFHF